MHIVQVSNDESLLTQAQDSEPVRRQIAYQAALDAQHPGATMTIVVCGRGSTHPTRRFGGLTILSVRGRWLLWLRVYQALSLLHRSSPINVVTSQKVYGDAWPALIFRFTHKVPIIGQIHFDIFNANARSGAFGKGIRGRILLRLMEVGLPRFNRIRVVGERTGADLVQRGLRTPHSIYVLPVPVPLLSSRPSPSSLAEKRVLFVGRLVDQKNLPGWLTLAKEVLAAHPDARFDIVGDGPDRATLEALAKSLGVADHVTFHGNIPYDRLGGFYSSARVFLLTSHYEGFGRVLVEAYAYGVPCIAVRNPGVEDIIQHSESGYLHDADDRAGLLRSVSSLLEDRELSRAMGSLGCSRVHERFNPDTLTRRNVAELLRAARPDSPILLPRRRTLGRLIHHWRQRASLLRSLQYEIVREISIKGRHLDLGGGQKASYLPLLRIQGTLESANIDPKMQPTHLLNLREPLPFPNGSFDGFITFNTLEHIFNDEFALAEAIRVTRPGGTFHILVPFGYRLHAAPWDFNRRTPYWWIEQLTLLGIEPEDFEIEPLVWSRLSSGLAFVEDGRAPTSRLLRKLSMLPALVRDAMPWQSASVDGRLIDTPKNRGESDFSVGFYISGRRSA